jgi:hypothetical protein
MAIRPVIFLFLFILNFEVFAQTKLNNKGFDLSNITIPIEFVKDGGPPRDGIPSIDNPEFTNISNANFLKEEDRILGVYFNGISKAYPVRILNFHEIVNDEFDGHPIVVTFCPLCGSGLAFNAMIDSKKRTFGVSGLLYNSDVLLYDRQSETLWSQILSEGVAGELVGEKLEVIQTYNTSWKSWKNQYPNTLVLSTNTGFSKDYSRDPYPAYYESEKVWFPVVNTNDAMHPKAKILGLEIEGVFKAYPFSELQKSKGIIQDIVNGQDLLIYYDKKEESAYITDTENNIITSTTLFWFAWVAFHPDTGIYTKKK